MKANFKKALCLILCLALSLGLLSACKASKGKGSKKSTSSKNSSSTETVSQPENNSSEDFADDFEEDDVDGDFEDDPTPEDEEDPELLFLSARVQNTVPLSSRYMGSGSGVYYCYPFLPESFGRTTTNAMAKVEMDRLQNMGVHTVRTMFKFLWARDEKLNAWNWESAEMQGVYKWMGEMKKRNIDVMLNPWNFSWLSTQSGSIPDTNYFSTADFKTNSNRFCAGVAELYRQMFARGYSNAKYLVLFTEPIYPEEISTAEYDKYIFNAKNLHQTLTAQGLRQNIKIMGPNRADMDTTLLKRCVKEADECFDIYSQHRYLSGENTTADTYYDYADESIGQLHRDFVATGSKKPFWSDEFNIQNAKLQEKGYSNVGFDDEYRGLQQAVGVVYGMNNGFDNLILWTLADQLWPGQRNTSTTAGFYDGVSRHGIFWNIQDTMVPKKQYYSYSLLSKYCGRGGGKTYPSQLSELYSGVYTACMQLEGGDWTFIAVNNNVEDVSLKVHFEKALGGVKLYRHQYVAAEVQPNIGAQIIPANKTILRVQKSFSDILRGGSLAVYTTEKG